MERNITTRWNGDYSWSLDKWALTCLWETGMNTRVYFCSMCIIKWHVSLLVSNQRKAYTIRIRGQARAFTGTWHRDISLAEYTCVFTFFTFIFELKETTTQHNSFYHVSLNELSHGNFQGPTEFTAYCYDDRIIVQMYDWVCPSRPRDDCVSSSDPSRGPSEYGGARPVCTTLRWLHR